MIPTLRAASRSAPLWAPVAAVVILGAAWGRDLPPWALVVALAALAGAVLAAVHHAEEIAYRVGEPLGSLVLAVAVTVIEVSLIVILMASSESGKPSLARDTVFAAVMITLNGIVGLSIVAATWRRPITRFHPSGTGAGLASIATLATLTMVLPTFTTSTPGATFSTPQLAFAAIASLVVYFVYVFAQTHRHRDYFQPVDVPAVHDAPATNVPSAHQPRFPWWASAVLLGVALVGVVGLGKVVSGPVEEAVVGAGLPVSVVAVAIASVVLLPETLAAWRASRRGHVQTSFNLAYGSAMASIGLTIPAVAVASWILGTRLELGLNGVALVLLGLTIAVSTLTVTPGKATLMQGTLHLTIFAGFTVLAFSP